MLPSASTHGSDSDPRFSGPWHSLQQRLFTPVDISFLVYFRIVLGAAMLWTVAELLQHDSLKTDYIRPPFHFTYHFFSWLKPWPGNGMYAHVAILGMCALFVCLGFLYRLNAVLMFLGFSYVFLLDKALYLNHYYLMCLFCLVMAILPANRRFAIDSWLWPSLRTDFVPAWTLWFLRFHVALPYVFGGIAKLKVDWLRGQPMASWLPISPLRYLIGPVVEHSWIALLLSWSAAIFDLTIIPLLLWRRTRSGAFCVAIAFHLANAFLFNIGLFPWLMIAATAIFFPPDWPRRLFQPKAPIAPDSQLHLPQWTIPKRAFAAIVCIYLLCQLVLPFRHLLYPGNVLWTEEGHLFAWNMMLRTKVTGVQVVVSDLKTKSAEYAEVMRWLTPRQFEEMTHDPEMMREFAHFVRQQYQAAGKEDVEVHVVALCSLNGRKPQLLVDPKVDLSNEPRTLAHKPWIVPLTEPFRWAAWDVPLADWHRLIELDLPQLDATK